MIENKQNIDSNIFRLLPLSSYVRMWTNVWSLWVKYPEMKCDVMWRWWWKKGSELSSKNRFWLLWLWPVCVLLVVEICARSLSSSGCDAVCLPGTAHQFSWWQLPLISAFACIFLFRRFSVLTQLQLKDHLDILLFREKVSFVFGFSDHHTFV